MSNKSNFIFGVVSVVIILVAVGGSFYYIYSQPRGRVVVPIATPDVKEEKTKQKQETREVLVNFADYLMECVKYKTTFVHPFTKEIMEREILGIIDGKCNYVEQMPNGGKMECKYSETERRSVAQFYLDVAGAESVNTKMSISINEDNKQTTTSLDGKEVVNPLQVATDNGTCVIVGY
jgi:hypothetical protein